MNIDKIVKKLEEELQKGNRREAIEVFEEQLSENIKELSEYENFFNLLLNNIFSVISKVDFNEMEENDKSIDIIKNIIKNLINKHFEEKETILILQNLNLTTFSSYQDIFSILDLITNCPILVSFCSLFKEQEQLVDKDFEYELQQKDKEIEKLKQGVSNFPEITEKPIDFEPDIFKTCKEGKLSSVQWLTEKEKGKLDIKVEKSNEELEIYKDDTPIHIATQNGHLQIVQYLIEQQNVDKEIKGFKDKKPLHYACEMGHLPIVEYLLSKGANIDAKDNRGGTPLHYACEYYQLDVVLYLLSKGANIEAKDSLGWTPLHYVSWKGYLPIVESLLAKGANIEAKDTDYWTPLHFASKYGKTNVVKYLVFKGANKNAKNKEGKRPSDIYYNDEIRNILNSQL